MGVTTRADEKIQQAKEKIKEAQILLLEVLNPDTYGHSELKESYLDEVTEFTLQLTKMNRKL